MAKMPPVSVVRSGLGDAERRHVVADERGRLVFGEGQLGPAVHCAAAVDHVVEDSVGGGRAEQASVTPPAQRLSRSRAMWVTWISSVPA